MATIWAIGRNYSDHAKEMQAPVPKSPLVFIKSMGCLTADERVALPAFSQDVHHELEIAVQLGPTLEVEKVALALDLTARDIQSEVKKLGQPWALAKSFKNSCPISEWIPFQDEQWFSQLQFQLKVNGKIRQQGKTHDMIFSLPILLQFLKQHFPLQAGDVILTGTPAGVGPLKKGDHIEAELTGQINWKTNFI